jgi:hypothetical protein
MALSQKRKPLRPAFRRRRTRNGTEAMVAVLAAIASLMLTTVSLGVYLRSAGLLTWIIIGLAIATFVYSLVRYIQVVGRRTARVGVPMVWLCTPRAWRIFLIICVVWGVAVIAIGDHVTLETPMVRDGHYVTTRYGHVVRYISSSEYRDLKMGRFRLFSGIAAIFAAFGATIGAARNRLETSDDSALTRFREPCS